MSVLWLRTAAALYSCGLAVRSDLSVSKEHTPVHPGVDCVFGAARCSIWSRSLNCWHETGHLPLNNFYETSSICAFLIAVFSCCLQLLPGRDFRRVPVPTGFFHDPDRSYRISGRVLEQSSGPERVADHPHLDGSDRICCADSVRRRFRLLFAAGTAAEEQAGELVRPTACPPSPPSTASSPSP